MMWDLLRRGRTVKGKSDSRKMLERAKNNQPEIDKLTSYLKEEQRANNFTIRVGMALQGHST